MVCSSKPRTVVCHICGREFGTASIDIHIPQCAKKWEQAEAQKPSGQRRPLPQRPDVTVSGDLEQYNKAAQEKFNDEGMMACQNCGRTFLPDRLEVHLRSCKPKAPPGKAPPAAPRQFQGERPPPADEKQQAMPPSVTCHICGRGFGTKSIDIHIPQCAQKWEQAEAQKPLDQRRPLPQRPDVTVSGDLEQYNKAAQEKFNDEGMMACQNCGRTFLPDRLEVHLRSCKPKAPPDKAPPAAPRQCHGERPPSADEKQQAMPPSVTCHICGRGFGTKSIDIHIPQCAQKWEQAEAQKPLDERRLVPQRPDNTRAMSLEDYNKAAQEKFNDEGMMACQNCGRTFLPDRLEVHLRSCKPKATLMGSDDCQRKSTRSPQQRNVDMTPELAVQSDGTHLPPVLPGRESLPVSTPRITSAPQHALGTGRPASASNDDKLPTPLRSSSPKRNTP
eukprot:TRINITY_DN25389_c0_g2_i6.p1 TRINITY_DN25389_c0_g2~~TRINITY_DN25389_c0_g2_i6.p1  ORF type:complete len:446 (-),score=46.53 TRINITY_DN25389_c0_g2_i6:557-1894(-)